MTPAEAERYIQYEHWPGCPLRDLRKPCDCEQRYGRQADPPLRTWDEVLDAPAPPWLP